MSKATVSPLQALANKSALAQAEAQFRLARLFTPFSYEPERVDFDRVAVFLDEPRKPFANPTPALDTAISRIEANLTEANALLGAFKAQGIEPTLDAEQLYVTARNNVIGNLRNTAGYTAAAA